MGDVYIWGNNNSGQMGNNSYMKEYIPKKIEFPNNVKITSVFAGPNISCSISEGGELYAFGSGNFGDGNHTRGSGPIKVLIPNGERIKKVSIGENHILALSTSGNIFAWGTNGYGQLGLGNNVGTGYPTKIEALSNIVDIGAGYAHSLAIDNDGGLYTWGYNIVGQLGDGSTTNRNIPQKIEIREVNGEKAKIEKILSASYYSDNSVVKSEAGTIFAWGYNYLGVVKEPKNGEAELIGVSTPKTLSAYDNITMAFFVRYTGYYMTDTDKIYVKGDNRYGELGFPEKLITNYLMKLQIPKVLRPSLVAGETFEYSITSSNMFEPEGSIFHIKYDPNKVKVIDLSKASTKVVTEAGYISDTKVMITEHDKTAGLIGLVLMDDNKNYTGILNTIRFEAIEDGTSILTVVHNPPIWE